MVCLLRVNITHTINANSTAKPSNHKTSGPVSASSVISVASVTGGGGGDEIVAVLVWIG